MTSPCNELNWWIEPDGSTHTAQSERLRPQGSLMAFGKVYQDSKTGIIIAIHNQPARTELMSSQLLDVLHARFPGTRWWIRDPQPVPEPHTNAAS